MIKAEQAGRSIQTVGNNSYVTLFEKHPKICLLSLSGLKKDNGQVASARREFCKAASEVHLRQAGSQIVFAHLDSDIKERVRAPAEQQSALSYYRHAFMKKFKISADHKFSPDSEQGSISIVDFREGVLKTLPIFMRKVKISGIPGMFSLLQYPSHNMIVHELEECGVALIKREDVVNKLISERYTDDYRHSSATIGLRNEMQ